MYVSFCRLVHVNAVATELEESVRYPGPRVKMVLNFPVLLGTEPRSTVKQYMLFFTVPSLQLKFWLLINLSIIYIFKV